jgi:hypothetical protein
MLKKTVTMNAVLPIVLLSLITSATQAQTIELPKKNGRIFYEIVDSTVQGRTKLQLYNASKLWVFNYFKQVEGVIHIDNPDDGMIVGTGTFRFDVKAMIGFQPNRCFYTFTITAKDNKYRIQVYDLVVATDSEQKERFPLEDPRPFYKYERYAAGVNSEVERLVASIQYSMQERPDDF